MGPIPISLLPQNTAMGEDGRVTIGGCDLVELAHEHGTDAVLVEVQRDAQQADHHAKAEKKKQVKLQMIFFYMADFMGQNSDHLCGGVSAHKGVEQGDPLVFTETGKIGIAMARAF